MKPLKRKISNRQVLKQFRVLWTVAKFSRLLTCQICIGTKNLQKNNHFSVCTIRLLADIDLRECLLIFHVQVKWPRKCLKNILAIFQEQEHHLILRKVLTRARERNIRFNQHKIRFRVNKVKYMDEVNNKILSFVSRYNHLGCMSRRFNCLLLVFIRRWRLVKRNLLNHYALLWLVGFQQLWLVHFDPRCTGGLFSQWSPFL